MEFCSGGSLQQVLSRRERNEEVFDEEEVFDWFIQIGKALLHVHDSKILHRDLKTSNVFLTKRNIVKLGDFGIARQELRLLTMATYYGYTYHAYTHHGLCFPCLFTTTDFDIARQVACNHR